MVVREQPYDWLGFQDATVVFYASYILLCRPAKHLLDALSEVVLGGSGAP